MAVGRKRSGTHSSVNRSSTPALQTEKSRLLVAWIHTEDDPSVRINQEAWPGIATGDLIEVNADPASETKVATFVFVIKNFEVEEAKKSRFQVSALDETISHKGEIEREILDFVSKKVGGTIQRRPIR